MGIEHRFKEDIPLSISNRIKYYIDQNYRFSGSPDVIWLNRSDYKELRDELTKVQRIQLKASAEHWHKRIASFVFLGASIVLNPESPSLPDTYEGMDEWVNKPLEEPK
jgi:hypothetical protein